MIPSSNGLLISGQEICILAVICLFYWCLDKNFAYRLGFIYFSAGLCIQTLKITFRFPPVDTGSRISPGCKRCSCRYRIFFSQRSHAGRHLPLCPSGSALPEILAEMSLHSDVSRHRIFTDVSGRTHAKRCADCYGRLPLLQQSSGNSETICWKKTGIRK